MNDLERELADNIREARIAQAREALLTAFADRDDAGALADAVPALETRLSSISPEERVLVATRSDAMAFSRYIKALAAYAEKFDYVSPHDLEIGEALEAIQQL